MYSLLYTVYSLPNIILPFFGGFFVDKFGARVCLVAFTLFLVIGQVRGQADTAWGSGRKLGRMVNTNCCTSLLSFADVCWLLGLAGGVLGGVGVPQHPCDAAGPCDLRPGRREPVGRAVRTAR